MPAPRWKMPCNAGEVAHEEGRAHQSIDVVNFQSWLQATLEQHQKDLAQEMIRQFETLRGLMRPNLKDSSNKNLLKNAYGSKEEYHADDHAFGASPVVEKTEVTLVNTLQEKKLDRSASASRLSEMERRMTTAIEELHVDSKKTAKTVSVSLQHEMESARSLASPKWLAALNVDIISSIVIVLNVVSMLIELEFHGKESRASLGMAPPFDWDNVSQVFDILEHIFNAVFIIELCIRLYLGGLAYFSNFINFVDIFLIGFTSIQLYVLRPLNLNVGETVTIFRVLRIFRFVRLLKVMQLPYFADLRILIFTCVSSLAALFWSMMLLFIAMFITALTMCNLLKEAIQDKSNDYQLRSWLYEYYGTTARSFYTMFEVTLAGCWPTYFRRLVQEVSIGYAFIAVLYITVVVFAVIRIITALFLKETLQVAAGDSQMQVNEKKAKTKKNLANLRKVFEAIDVESDGVLLYEEFMKVTANPNVVVLLESLELSLHDLQSLWDMLDNGDGVVTYEEFILGVARLKGQARSLDVLSVARHVDQVRESLKAIMGRLTTIESRM